jgi:hypothetical protein
MAFNDKKQNLKLRFVPKSNDWNGTEHVRHYCRKTIVLSCHRCLINSGVEKMNNI